MATGTQPEGLEEARDAGQHMLGVRTGADLALLHPIVQQGWEGGQGKIWNEQQVLLEKIWNEQQVLQQVQLQEFGTLHLVQGSPRLWQCLGSNCAWELCCVLQDPPGVPEPLAQAASLCKGFSNMDREGWSLLTITGTRVLAQSVSRAPCLHSYRKKPWAVPWQQWDDVNSHQQPQTEQGESTTPEASLAGHQLIWGSVLEHTGHSKDQWVHLPVLS